MSDRELELAERHAELRLQCAVQRRVVAAEVENLEARFRSVDRFAILTRSALLQPRVLLAGVIALVVFGRIRAFSTIGRAFLLMTAARRLWRAAKLL
ncbi:MAG: hypothetical protein ABI640_03580 [Gammaproteobacteria bacterium]